MWTEPKTDWRETDYFNIADYNRIKANLSHLRDMAVPLWQAFALADMGADKTHNDYSFYADEINRFEDNLEAICVNTYPFAIGDKKTYHANSPFIDHGELNRIEKACLLIYNNLKGQADSLSRLSFKLKGGGQPWL